MRGVCARVRSHARNESNSRRFSPRKLASKSANGNVGPATTGSRIDRNVAEKRAKYARTMLLSPPSFCPLPPRMFSTWWLVVPHVIAPSCSSSRFRRADPMSPTRCHVDECARELSRINTYGNEPIDRFGASVLEQGGYVSIFNARIGKGFGWSIGDRTGQG